ncbi:MAG: 2-dehydropantoate 2-reductase N-terminal domain-containing protein [Anaerolineales bacterium]|nr:2-dehydropantoate 2-reductase N-terminal domain-containing protein [Anaerolineales bacterium]
MQTSGFQRLSVLTFGAGAIGTYIGGSLALAGHRLVFIEQPAVAAELRERGLSLDLTIDERRKTKEIFVVRPSSFACVSSLAEALKHSPFDVAIFALKSFDTAAALEGMKPYAEGLPSRCCASAEKMPPVLCLQNGVDNEPAMAAVLGADKVIYGTVTSSIGRRAAGDIVLEKLRGVGVAGAEQSRGADGHPLSERLIAALEGAYLNARLYPRAADMKWSKMLTNLIANATAAILDMTPAEVFVHPRLFSLEMAMLREALAVMKAQGVRAVDLPGTPVRALALAARFPAFIARPFLAKAVGGGRGGKMPSFHIDLHSGRGQSEVDWLNGAVARYGEKCGLPTPVNKVVNKTLLALTRGEIPLAEFSRQPEKLLALVR